MNPSVLLINTSIPDILYVYPLGLDYLASSLRQAGTHVDCLDLAICEPEQQEVALRKKLTEERYDFVAFNLRNLCDQSPTRVRYIPGIQKIILQARQLLTDQNKEATLVLGGAAASLAPDFLLHHMGVDAVVCGDGEAGFAELFERCRHRKVKGELIRASTDISSIVYSRGSWGHIDEYLKRGADGNLQTKRGCNQVCVFCSYPVIEGKSIRMRDPVLAAREFLQLEARGFKKIYIVDAVFNNPLSHAKEVLSEFRKAGTRAEWTGFFSPKLVDRELLRLVKATHGGRPLKLTIETGSDAMLDALGKGFTRREIAMATRLCREEDVPYSFTVLLGGPGENRDTIAETCELILNEKPAYVSASIGVYLYPKTRLAEATRDTLWNSETELFGNMIYPVERDVIKRQFEETLSKSGFPVYVH